MADLRLVNGNLVKVDFSTEGSIRLVNGVLVKSTTAAAPGGTTPKGPLGMPFRVPFTGPLG